MRNRRARVSFVVVSWNTRDLVIRCLTELMAQARKLDGEVLLVDNASSDGTAEAVAQVLPGVHVLRNTENLGFARAVNQALRVSSGAIVALVNSDISIGEADLGFLVQIAENDRTVGASGCALVDGSGLPWTYDNRFPTPLGIALEGLVPNALSRLVPSGRARTRFELRPHVSGPLSATGRTLFEVDWIAGACLFLRRDVLEEIGLLDENFFLYKEDVDLCLRLRNAGYRIVHCPEVRLTHLVAQSTRRNPTLDAGRARIEGSKSSARYARKHFGSITGAFVVGAIRAGLLVRLVKSGVSWLVLHREQDRNKVAWMRRALLARHEFALDGAPVLEPIKEVAGKELA